MKNHTGNILILFALLLGSLTSCDDMHSIDIDQDNSSIEGVGGLMVLCEGRLSLNNSTLSVFDMQKKTLISDFFQQANGRKMGDTGNDLKRYGSKLYVIVNGSGQLEVLNAVTGKSIRQLSFVVSGKNKQPRSLAFWNDKAYVCCFDGSVVRLDTATLDMEATVQAGRNPDGITASNGKLYVSNSGGLDFNSGLSYDNSVSVVDIESFAEIKKIEVGLNPGCIVSDNLGHVYVSVRGDYAAESGTWVCIDAQQDVVSQVYPMAVTKCCILDEKAYYYYWNEKSGENQIGVFDLVSKEVDNEQFITDGTLLETPYGIDADPENRLIYMTDAHGFETFGDVLCFNTSGQLLYRIRQVGNNPSICLSIPDFNPDPFEQPDTTATIPDGIASVFDFSPAPGQFVGVYPKDVSGETKADYLHRVLQQLRGNLVSLGGYGGSITFGFDSLVHNREGIDFKIFGNAFSGSSEPGIVEVSVDENKNGLPDDAWFELAGSEFASNTTKKGYRLVYYRPLVAGDSIRWTDNQGSGGMLKRKYPKWAGDSVVWTGSLLAANAERSASGFWVYKNLPWGYVDNQPNDSDLCGFDLDWARDAQGNAVVLEKIHFVRVYTGVHLSMGGLGEISTEISGAKNLHP